jgi:hypothetical protein
MQRVIPIALLLEKQKVQVVQSRNEFGINCNTIDAM